MPRFDNIIFDMDGLIVDSEPLHQRAFNTVLAVAGASYQFDTTEYGHLFTGRSILENSEYIQQRFDLPQNPLLLGESQRAMFNLLIADARNLDPMPGLAELLAWLHDQRFRIAIASSSRPEQVNLIIKNLKLDHYFSAIVGNDGSMKPKPAPDVYLLALRQIGADPARTLALEDSSSGVQAAHNAGLYVIAIPNGFTRHQDFSVADLVLQDLHHVIKFLNKELIFESPK